MTPVGWFILALLTFVLMLLIFAPHRDMVAEYEVNIAEAKQIIERLTKEIYYGRKQKT